MNQRYIGLVLLVLLLVGNCQQGRRGGRKSGGTAEEPGMFESLINLLFPGSPDTSIFQRILNKLSWYTSAIFGAIASYFMFFRKNKQRN